MIDFDQYPEMAPYLDEPRAMHIGSPGKQGYLLLGFELDAQGKSILRDLDRRHPLIVQQELYFDEAMPEMPCVYILSSGGPNVNGDRYRQDIIVRQNAYAHITTGAATKLAEMCYNYSALQQTFTLEENAYLEYLPEPVIPCRHTRFICDTSMLVAPSATLFYAEIFKSGRRYYKGGERFAYDILSVCSHGERPDGTPLFREKFIVRPHRQPPQMLGVMDGCDVFANVLVLTPSDKADSIYAQTDAFIDTHQELAAGISYLPHQAGLVYKVIGKENAPVKALVREFCSIVRQEVKGRPLPEEFPWR